MTYRFNINDRVYYPERYNEVVWIVTKRNDFPPYGEVYGLKRETPAKDEFTYLYLVRGAELILAHPKDVSQKLRGDFTPLPPERQDGGEDKYSGYKTVIGFDQQTDSMTINHLPVLNEPKYKIKDLVWYNDVVMTVINRKVEHKTGKWIYALDDGTSCYVYEHELSSIVTPGYPPTLDEIALDEYNRNQKQKRGFKQIMNRFFQMCESWLDPDKKEIVKAFMDTNAGTINFEHPELQKYLIEQWATDKKLVALAKQINKDKEPKTK